MGGLSFPGLCLALLSDEFQWVWFWATTAREQCSSELSSHNFAKQKIFTWMYGSWRAQLVATNQESGQMSLYWLTIDGKPWAKIWKEHRNIRNRYCPGGAFNVAREEGIGPWSWSEGWVSQAGIRPEETDIIKVGVCTPEGLSIRKSAGQGPDEETGTGIQSGEKKKPCRGTECYMMGVKLPGGTDSWGTRWGKVMYPECPDSELSWILDTFRE